jgi:hypothetical protein
MPPSRSRPAPPVNDATPDELLRVLADPERLQIAGALAARPRSPDELSEELGLPPARVRRHLARLSGAGLASVDADRRTYALVPETLREAAREVGPPREAGLALGAVYEEEEAVLRSYFRAGRLREIPARQSKRRVVLTRLALEFEPGVRYSEPEVNEMLRRFHPDVAALRRYLVDEEFLGRDRTGYWRTGGPVETGAS